MLLYPMLDDRNQTVSSHQYVDTGAWSRGTNDVGWDALLGERRLTDQVSIYAAPIRAADLSGLPPTFIDCGSAEVFRDEDVAYAKQIWNDGGVCELHVWPGAWHAPGGCGPGCHHQQGNGRRAHGVAPAAAGHLTKLLMELMPRRGATSTR